MTPHRAKGQRTWRVYLPTRVGGWKIRSTGTRDRTTARAMGRMLEDLGPRGWREWDLLEAVLEGRLTLAALYDAYRMERLAQLRAELQDLDLAPYLDRWQQWLVGRVAPATIARRRAHLVLLHQDRRPWHRSTLTRKACEAWLSELPVSADTKRSYYASLASFLSYLQSIGVESGDPLRQLRPPPASPPRIVFLELPDVQHVVDTSAEPYRTLFALLYGSGLDLSTALQLRRRDVNVQIQEIRARGGKTPYRDRVVIVSSWAWPYVEQLCQNRLPEAALFPGVNRWGASDAHRVVLERLELRGMGRLALRLHDARHHWAVRAARAGMPIELVAQQLGHRDGLLAMKCYGRFAPSIEDRRRWEREASRLEEQRRKG